MGISALPSTPRLVNRFKLGADPEFSFHDAKKRYIYAETLGLTTLNGFGCDMAGRQAEIRAYPSRFTLEVVASIIDSLRWMAYAHGEDVLPLAWVATAFNGKDGCGGHIHFGRRRPGRTLEVTILDSMTASFLAMGIFDKHSFRARQVENPNQHYGQYGDIRLQAHGYEYRTLPTELTNPWLTYFVMVVSKLLLYQGRVWSSSLTESFDGIIALLQKYQDIDDDAAIALMALEKHGFPKECVKDFKPHWGIPVGVGNDSTAFFPSSIKAEDRTCLELFEYLVHGVPLPSRVPNPTWEPFKLPKGFSRVGIQKHTLGHLPDVAMNLVSRYIPVSVGVGDSFRIYHGVTIPVNRIREALKPKVENVQFFALSTPTIEISIPSGFNKSLDQCKYLHKVLSDPTLFPVCKATEMYNTDWSKWVVTAPPTKPAFGKLIARVAGKPKEVVPAKQELVLRTKIRREVDF